MNPKKAPLPKSPFDASPYTFGIVVSRFNGNVTKKLLEAARECLRRSGARLVAGDTVHCPGAFEIPYTALELSRKKNFDAIICLGCIIRGDTPHFEYIAQAVSTGICRVSLDTNIPLAFGVLTTDTLAQALDRAGKDAANKGWEAALAAVEMARLRRELRRTS
jgi:6,7-dimethyl-8-ribityllumazine synthase